MSTALIVGIDAGGTTVRVVIAEVATGAPVQSLQVPACAEGTPPPGLLPSLSGVVAVCAGIAKFTRDGIPECWTRFLTETFPEAAVAVVPDYEIAFRAAVPDGNGAVVIAGTGSVAFGRNARTDTSVRVGGRGWEWGDEGSGAWLTTEMVRRTLRALDGQARHTALTDTVCAFLQTEEPGLLAARARQRAGETGEGRGFLLPLLVRLRSEGNTEARDLFVGAGGWLSALASTAVEQLGFLTGDPVTIAGVGGVWKAGGDTLAEAFATALRRRYSEARIAYSETAPVGGAIHLARERAGRTS